MRTHRTPALFVGLLVATVAVAAGACANPDTQTPNCTPNVDSNGIKPDPNGCAQFAQCIVGGSVAPASQCCVSADGGPFVGNDLSACLHGYGDPSCAYLITTTTMMGMDVVYTCSKTPPSSSSGAGGGGGGSSPNDGGGNG